MTFWFSSRLSENEDRGSVLTQKAAYSDANGCSMPRIRSDGRMLTQEVPEGQTVYLIGGLLLPGLAVEFLPLLGLLLLFLLPFDVALCLTLNDLLLTVTLPVALT